MNKMFLCFVAVWITACHSSSGVYTLYRNSVTDENMRIHVATFDAATSGVGGEDYNQGNCKIAMELYQAQPGVKTKFWCEKGRFQE